MHQPVREILAPVRPVGWVAAVVLSLMCAVVVLTGLRDAIDADAPLTYAGTVLLWAAVETVLLAACTGRIEARGDILVVKGAVLEDWVPRSLVAGADGRNGLIVELADGTWIESFAYGSSLFQVWVRSRRYAEAAVRILAWSRAGLPDPTAGPRRRRLRRMYVAGFVVVLVVAATLGVIVWTWPAPFVGLVNGGW